MTMRQPSSSRSEFRIRVDQLGCTKLRHLHRRSKPDANVRVAARPDAEQLLAPATDEEVKKILRKVDPIVVPLCLFAFRE
jgi:hypothetical protein